MKHPGSTEFDQLKDILIGEEKKSLDDLHRRITDLRLRSRDTAEILPESIAMGHQRDDRLVQALKAPVNECVRQSVRRDSKMFADALFPVIGPAIRKSIVEALKSMVQSMNQALDQSLSLKGLRWRWESIRTGTPFPEIVLKHTLQYRVEQLFLIHGQSGILIEHLSHAGAATQDNDAVAAMLTAIQDFVRDSFAPARGDHLGEVDFGEMTVWICHGPHAILACVIRGIPPREAKGQMQEALDKIHRQFADQLETYSGDDETWVGLQPLLEACLLYQLKEGRDEGKRRKFSWPFVLVSLLIFVGLGFWIGYSFWYNRKLDALKSRLEQTPGIWVTNIGSEGGATVVKGLRDPLAEAPETIAADLGFKPGSLAFSLTPFQSLEPALIEKRAARQLNPPESVSLKLEGETLVVSGLASQTWLDGVARATVLPPGVERVDTSSVTLSLDSLRTWAQTALNPPPELKLNVNEDRGLVLRGEASWQWLQPRFKILGEWRGTTFSDIHLNDLTVTEWSRLNTLAGEAQQLSIFFTRQARLSPESAPQLDRLAADLMNLDQLATLLGISYRVRVQGFSDGLGSLAGNLRIQASRAQTVIDALAQRGVNAATLEPVTQQDYQPDQRRDEDRRRVSLTVELEPLNLQEHMAP